MKRKPKKLLLLNLQSEYICLSGGYDENYHPVNALLVRLFGIATMVEWAFFLQ